MQLSYSLQLSQTNTPRGMFGRVRLYLRLNCPLHPEGGGGSPLQLLPLNHPGLCPQLRSSNLGVHEDDLPVE